MAKKITIRIDDETARMIDELSKRTQVPKVRLAKQAYSLLFSFYKKLTELYEEEMVDINFMEIVKNNNGEKNKK